MTNIHGTVPLPIERRILVLRGQRVMLDSDLAVIYGVTTKRLNQATRRNMKRFPTDFIFQLTEKEKSEVVTICDHLARLRFSPHLPYAFTEHGAIMLATVLSSPVAVQASVAVVRAFVRMRAASSLHGELSEKLDAMEGRVAEHDEHIRSLFVAIRQLMVPPEEPPRQIGFRPG